MVESTSNERYEMKWIKHSEILYLQVHSKVPNLGFLHIENIRGTEFECQFEYNNNKIYVHQKI